MKKNRTGLLIFLILLILLIITGVLFLLNFDKTQNSPKIDLRINSSPFQFSFSKDSSMTPTFSEYIAILYIEGTITEKTKTYDHKKFIQTVKNLQTDTKNVGIMLFIDSPGGTVYHSDEIYLTLKNYSKTNKPVWAYLGSMAASGGYYIACAADKIIANRNCLTGSIGVIAGQSVDITGFLEKHGIKMTTITAGKNKNMLNIDSPVTDEQKAIMQSIADEAYEQFTGIIAASRGLTIAQTKKLADGRIFTANQALKNKLIDATDSFENTIDKFTEELSENLSKKVKVKHIENKSKNNIADFFMEKIQNIIPKNELENVVNMFALPDNLDFPAYYYAK